MSAQLSVVARLGSRAEDYERFGIRPGCIERREDGMRTDGSKGTFEWWYFDAEFADGSRVVITFYSKDYNEPGKSLAPFAGIVYDGADGTRLVSRTAVFDADFSASTATCDVRIGPNRFVGNLHVYDIHIETDEIVVDATLTGEIPAWRPESGHFLFEGNGEPYFAWLASVPRGRVEATITERGATVKVTGTGYHDHNWGNIALTKVINNWYWGRGQAGPYTVIACHLTAAAPVEFASIPILMLAKHGRVIADDSANVTFTSTELHVDGETSKPVSHLLTYEYFDGAISYIVTWRREKTILKTRFINHYYGLKYLMARIKGFDGAYLRFTGQLSVQTVDGIRPIETETGHAIWELMYLGRGGGTGQ